MRKFLIGIALLLIGGGLGYGAASTVQDFDQAMDYYRPMPDRQTIREILLEQSQAWNRGDIDAFMQPYLQSGDLRFASGGTVTTGWQTTLERYKSRYPDRAAMGTLAFTNLDVDMLSDTDALVFGRWELTRESDTPNGLFTLHFKKFENDWVIVSDHTSSAD